MTQFILGIGAQKSGTTWLYDYLVTNGDLRRGRIRPKELHVWDHREIEEFRPRRRRVTQITNLSRYHLWRMERAPDYYFDYFAKVLSRGGTAVDITPSYAGLSQDTFERIAEGFEARGIKVKCVFLLRDPVDRCVSGFAHNKVRARAGEVRMGVDDAQAVTEAFRSYVTSQSCAYRTRYEETIAKATAAFGSERFKAVLFEEIFKGDGLRGLTAFLDLPYRPEQLGKMANVARRTFDIPEAARAFCAMEYEATYRATLEMLPASKELWSGWKYLT
ncbi:MAG TPA: hypothetical protein DEO85_04285 [Maritimibacter sp.]|nr:hypothetical protein [Maritimibacter sp.]